MLASLLVARAEAAETPPAIEQLLVEPPSVRLTDVRQPWSLVVVGRTKLGETIDFTREAKYASGDEKKVRVSAML